MWYFNINSRKHKVYYRVCGEGFFLRLISSHIESKYKKLCLKSQYVPVQMFQSLISVNKVSFQNANKKKKKKSKALYQVKVIEANSSLL